MYSIRCGTRDIRLGCVVLAALSRPAVGQPPPTQRPIVASAEVEANCNYEFSADQTLKETLKQTLKDTDLEKIK
jgi:hypothetical protein